MARLPKSHRQRRFYIILWLAFLTTSLIIYGGYLSLTQHPSFIEWTSFIVIVVPILLGIIGAWLNIDTMKMRGGQSE